jgi:hypothetical protein
MNRRETILTKFPSLASQIISIPIQLKSMQAIRTRKNKIHKSLQSGMKTKPEKPNPKDIA